MSKFDFARKVLIAQATESKNVFTVEIESGYRKFDVIEKALDEYKDCIQASDFLAKIQMKEFEGIKFNINNYVKVKLTEKGKKVLKKQHDELEKLCKSIGKFHEPETDENGYTKFQLWDLMRTFGSYIGLGMNDLCFETTIIILEKDIE